MENRIRTILTRNMYLYVTNLYLYKHLFKFTLVNIVSLFDNLTKET